MRLSISGDYVILREEEYDEVISLLRSLEFSAPRQKCPVCAGWNMSENGETPRAHTAVCLMKKVLDAS